MHVRPNKKMMRCRVRLQDWFLTAEGSGQQKRLTDSLHTLCTCGADTRVARGDQHIDRNRNSSTFTEYSGEFTDAVRT